MIVDPVDLIVRIGAVLTALTIIGVAARVIGRMARRVGDIHDDWRGEPARPGVEARPGVMERLKTIEEEMRPNGGGSMRDAVNRLEVRLTSVETKLAHYIEAQQPVNVNVNVPPSQLGGTP